MTRVIQTRKLTFGLIIIAANAWLFYTYTWNEMQNITSNSIHESKLSMWDVEFPSQHTEQSGERLYNTPRLIIYNKVPKTGSTTIVNIAYKLTKRNHFNMLLLTVTSPYSHYLSVLDQRFVQNISLWVDKHPAIYHGHIQYLDFTRFGYRNPIYINLVRDPIARFISYYYLLPFGNDSEVKSLKDTKTLDKCIEIRGKDCDLAKMLWIQIPFFCGQSPQCLTPDRWALYQAKNNLLNHFLLVGVTEQLGDFVALLETMLPQYFSGAYDLYTNTELDHLRNTGSKKKPSKRTLATIKQTLIYQLEQEFYEFARDQFNFLKFRTLARDGNDSVIIHSPKFKYDKIMPDKM